MSAATAGRIGDRSQQGFTLLEVMIAVLILALALVALVRTTALEASALTQVRDSTHAQWVAANVIAEVRLGEGFPEQGRRTGRTEMANRGWRWQLEVSATQEPAIRRLDVSVYVDDAGAEARDEAVARLSGFAWQ